MKNTQARTVHYVKYLGFKGLMSLKRELGTIKNIHSLYRGKYKKKKRNNITSMHRKLN